MDKMIDMALSDKESADMVSPATAPTKPKGPRYPYGLCVSLDNESMKKLGLSTTELPDIGDMIHFMAMATVTSVSSNKVEGGEDCCRVELQITHMSFEDENREEPGETSERRAKARYGGDEEEGDEEE